MKKSSALAVFVLGLFLLFAAPRAYPQQTNAITIPKNGSRVNHFVRVLGVCKHIPKNKCMWLVVQPQGNHGYFPQSGAREGGPLLKGCDGNWTGNAYIGKDEESNVGEKFGLLMVEADESACKAVQDYLSSVGKRGNYQGMPKLPKGSKVLHRVSVTRKKG